MNLIVLEKFVIFQMIVETNKRGNIGKRDEVAKV